MIKQPEQPPLEERFPALAHLGRKSRKRIPYIAQTAATDCGAACLAMILAYHGKKVLSREILDVLTVGRDGSNAESLLRAADWFGLRGRGVRAETVKSLRLVTAGAILHWGFRHYVVFERLTRDGAIIVDPAVGRREVSEAELRSSFTGVALLFEPGAAFERSNDRPLGLHRYIRPIMQQSRTMVRLLSLSVLVQLLALGLPLLTGALVDRVVPRQDYDLLWVLTVGLSGIVGFQFLASLIRAHLMIHLRTNLDAKVTLDFLDHLVALPYSFFQIRSAGDLMMRLNSNAMVREILTSTALSGFFDGLLVFSYLILLFALDPLMGGLSLLLGILRIVLFLVTRRRHRDLMSETLQTQAVSRGWQVQMLSGIETLKAMGVERQAVQRWSNLFADELNASIARDRLNAIFQSLLGLLSGVSTFAILVLGIYQVLKGQLTLGTMFALSSVAAGFLGPLSTLVSTALQLQLLGSYMDRINDVFETQPEQDHTKVRLAPRLRGEIEVDRVSFRYNNESPLVIDNVSIKIPAGRFVALVGPSGAGKTTLAHLLVGLYNPTSGRILYDGADLQTLELRSLRAQLGVVTQHPYLLGSSIRANIALADPTIPLERIIRAAKLARIHDQIMAMPMGYETLIGSGGASLSGGQQQRVALARALVNQPAILLLDEATSDLDTTTEKLIQRELDRLRCTRIVIAHRLSTVQSADVILVVDGGRVTESGTHRELTANRGTYSTLVSAQALQST